MEQEQNHKYLGLTIGPIYKTFSNVRRTRELWVASFCFSYLMRTIIEQLPKEDIILPYVDNDKLFETKGIGLFPDRIILKANSLSLESFKKKIDDSIRELASEIMLCLKTAGDINDIQKYLTEYFQISYFEKEFELPLTNPIIDLSHYLDSLEQFTKYVAVENEGSRNYLKEFFSEVNNREYLKESFLDKHYEIKDVNGLNDPNGKVRIESLIEIATRELRSEKMYKPLINKHLWDKDKNKDREDNKLEKKSTDSDFLNELITQLNEKYKGDMSVQNPFRTYHKYICILKADGDKIGTYLKDLSTERDVQRFSTQLMEWAQDTYKIVKSYEGVPIFIGGDDLLCIVPVCNGDKNIFSLIEDIDAAFNKQFKGTQATLSYGVSISYYKYPLSEALEISDSLLREAKNAGGNRIAIQLLKHSGNELQSIVDKNSRVYQQTIDHLLALLKKYSGNKELKSVINNSVLYKIRDNYHLLKNILNQPERLINFINNNFDAKAEGQKYDEIQTCMDDKGKLMFEDPLKEQYFFNLKEMMNLTFEAKKNRLIKENMGVLTEETLKEVFSTFRIVKFIKGYEDDKE